MIIRSALSRFAQTINPDNVNIPTPSLQQTTISDGLQIFFMIAGAISLLVITVGALQYTISRGDTNAIKKAKETIIYAAIGLLVTLAAYGIVTFVFTNL